MGIIKTSFDEIINGIFKGDMINGFAPAIYLIKPSQSAVTIDGSKTLVSLYINKISVSVCVCMYVCNTKALNRQYLGIRMIHR